VGLFVPLVHSLPGLELLLDPRNGGLGDAGLVGDVPDRQAVIEKCCDPGLIHVRDLAQGPEAGAVADLELGLERLGGVAVKAAPLLDVHLEAAALRGS
jgi:hypothetical protein